MTVIAVITHPEGGENHPAKKVLNGQRRRVALQSTLRLLDKFKFVVEGRGKRVAVLTSPAPAAADYAKLVAGHFAVDLCTYEGLLRDCSSRNFEDACYCVGDFLNPKFDLAVAIVARGIGRKLAAQLAEDVGRPYEEIRAPMAHAYII